MTDIEYFDGVTPISRKGYMLPYMSNIQLVLQDESGKKENLYIKYDEITEISKLGSKSRIELKGDGNLIANRLIIFREIKTHNLIKKYWAADKKSNIDSVFIKFKNLSNIKKAALAAILAPCTLILILQFLDKSYILLPLSVDKKFGALVSENLLNYSKVIDNQIISDALENINSRIIPENSYYKYNIKLVKNPAINAFALPDGQIIVFTGLIAASKSPEEIAGVLAHEISHVELRHGIRQLIRVMGISYLTAVVIGVGFEGAEIPETISEIANVLIYVKYSQEFEKEADLNAVALLHNAGISIKGFISFFDRLIHNEKTPEILSWISTHPDNKTRSDYLKEKLKQEKFISKKLLSNEKWIALKNLTNSI